VINSSCNTGSVVLVIYAAVTHGYLVKYTEKCVFTVAGKLSVVQDAAAAVCAMVLF